MYTVFESKLKEHVQKVQSGDTEVQNWASIECIITCMSELASTLSTNELGALKDII